MTQYLNNSVSALQGLETEFLIILVGLEFISNHLNIFSDKKHADKLKENSNWNSNFQLLYLVLRII